MARHGKGGARVSQTGDVHVEVDEFTELFGKLKEFAPAERKAIRKNISAAAKPVVASVRKAVLAIPVRGRKRKWEREHPHHLRANVAKGIRLQVSDSPRSMTQGVFIRASTSKAMRDEGQSGMQRALNLERFRHPVFGDRERWVDQHSHPYFAESIRPHTEGLRTAVEAAIDEARAAVERL